MLVFGILLFLLPVNVKVALSTILLSPSSDVLSLFFFNLAKKYGYARGQRGHFFPFSHSIGLCTWSNETTASALCPSTASFSLKIVLAFLPVFYCFCISIAPLQSRQMKFLLIILQFKCCCCIYESLSIIYQCVSFLFVLCSSVSAQYKICK